MAAKPVDHGTEVGRVVERPIAVVPDDLGEPVATRTLRAGHDECNQCPALPGAGRCHVIIADNDPDRSEDSDVHLQPSHRSGLRAVTDSVMQTGRDLPRSSP